MQILEIVIGLVFVMLLFSLLATTIMETLSGVLALRGQNLRKALKHILAHDGNEKIFKEFEQSELYKQLSSKRFGGTKYRPPSYVSADSFWMIMSNLLFKGTKNNLDSIRSRVHNLDEEGKIGHHLKEVMIQILNETERIDSASKNVDKIKSSVEFIQNEDVKNQIIAYADGVESKMDLFKDNIEEWYNNIMDRTTGWYKRQTQAILFGIGLAISISFNADTISIYKELSADPTLALNIANQAQAYMNNQDARGMNPNFDIVSDSELGTLRQLIKEDIASIESPLGVGWQLVDIKTMSFGDWAIKILGWLVTSFAVMLGAPFWFDMLRKLVNIRNTGNKP